jgi:hypothetical protein
LTLNPLFDFGSSEAPQFADMNATHYAFARELLESFWMNLHD